MTSARARFAMDRRGAGGARPAPAEVLVFVLLLAVAAAISYGIYRGRVGERTSELFESERAELSRDLSSFRITLERSGGIHEEHDVAAVLQALRFDPRVVPTQAVDGNEVAGTRRLGDRIRGSLPLAAREPSLVVERDLGEQRADLVGRGRFESIRLGALNASILLAAWLVLWAAATPAGGRLVPPDVRHEPGSHARRRGRHSPRREPHRRGAARTARRFGRGNARHTGAGPRRRRRDVVDEGVPRRGAVAGRDRREARLQRRRGAAPRPLGRDRPRAGRDRTHELPERVVTVAEDERRRLAEDLHDGPVQQLVAAGLRLEQGRVDAEGLVRDALEQLRAIAHRLHPATGRPAGLPELLEHLVTTHQDLGGPRVRLTCEVEAQPPEAVRFAAARSVMEALTNVRKHAGATAVDVDVRADERSTQVIVRDDGSGFDPSRRTALRPPGPPLDP